MLYVYTVGVPPASFHVEDYLSLEFALSAWCVQADGDELDHIIREIPALSTKYLVQRFYGVDAVKAALVFVER